MSERMLRRLWFVGFFVLLPWPLWIGFDGFVPAVRYTLLGAVASAVALVEGASGPVGLIVGLLVGMSVATTAGCCVLAWLAAKLLAPLRPLSQRLVLVSVLGGGLVFALLFRPYRTPFGRALTGGLLDVLS